MKKMRKRVLAILLAITTFVSVAVPTEAAAATVSNYGALLDSYAAQSGSFTLSTSSRFFVVSNSAPTGELLQTVQLANREFAAKKYPSTAALPIVWGAESLAEAGDIVIKKDSSLAMEAYRLNVTDKAVVTYSDVDGLLYGMNSLMKFFIMDGDMTLSGFTAADAPDTKERTVMLDTGRKYYTVEWICNFIRQMSWMGYNALEVHFSEDGGFRADLWDETYYKDGFRPENDFTWLCGSHVQSWVKDPYRNDPDAGEYLTTKELVEICETAKEYHIEIIPSFDSPSHMDYITWKFEQNYKSNKSYSFKYNGKTYQAAATSGCINYTGKKGDASPTWPYYTTVDITDGTMAKAFVFALYEDIADFFKEYAGSTNFNIGADEVNLTSYSSTYPRTWKYSDFPGYVNELNGMLNGKGYKVRMFNDFIGSTTYNQEYDTSEGISSYNSKYEFDKNIEIMYWNSDYNPTSGKYDENIWHVKFFWEKNTGTVDNWGDGGRTMYNCIQTNCYYVLREGIEGAHRDARDPNNRNWTFYGSNEQDIYNNWYPADISEKGAYKEDAVDVPADQLGGAYFLIWNDYAALSTESQVWNGALDCYDKDQTYYLFDRMHSNIIKMWNSDINSSVTYAQFAAVRDKISDGSDSTADYFPGFRKCSEEASLPAAGSVSKATADNSELVAALKNKISNEYNLYTAESYSSYESVYASAKKVAENSDATADQISDAVTALQSAKGALVKNTLTVHYKEKDGSKSVKNSNTESYNATGNYKFTVPTIEGYVYDSVSSNASYDSASNTISGALKDGTEVTVWYAAKGLSLDKLQKLVDEEITEQGDYTDETWSAYKTALENAKTALENSAELTQDQIDEVAAALENAKDNLAAENAATSIESVRTLASATRAKRPIGLLVKTTSDVTSIKVKDSEGKQVTLSNERCGKVGTTGKLWLIKYYAPKDSGNYTYTIAVQGAKTVVKEITVTVK